jgi:DNA-binding NarL/FixJ family response regulator
VIKVLIIAAYPLIREGLRSLVVQHDDLKVSGEARFVDEAISLVQADPPDVVLLNAGQADDFENAVGQLLEAAPTTKIIGLAESADEVRIVNALASGAKGLISRDVSTDEMGNAIRAAHSNLLVLGPAPAATLLARLRPIAETEGIEPLTEREMEVLRLMARGLGNRQIASDLKITEHTVKFHIGTILSKLHAANRTEAVSIALQNGLVTL